MVFIILSMHYLHYLSWLIILTVSWGWGDSLAKQIMAVWTRNVSEMLGPGLRVYGLASFPDHSLWFLQCGQAFDLAASCSSCLLPCCPCHRGTISQKKCFFYKLLLVMVFYKPLKCPSLVNHTNFPLVIWVCFMCGFLLHFLWSSLSMTSSMSPSSHTFSEWYG